jgi:hypothetical protein
MLRSSQERLTRLIGNLEGDVPGSALNVPASELAKAVAGDEKFKSVLLAFALKKSKEDKIQPPVIPNDEHLFGNKTASALYGAVVRANNRKLKQ